MISNCFVTKVRKEKGERGGERAKIDESKIKTLGSELAVVGPVGPVLSTGTVSYTYVISA